MAAIRQEQRQSLHEFPPRLVELPQRFCFASARGDAIKGPIFGAEDNGAVRTPTSAREFRHIAKCCPDAALQIDLVELLICNKSQCSIVRRPKRRRCAFCPCQRPRCKGIERANPKKTCAPCDGRDESNASAIR